MRLARSSQLVGSFAVVFVVLYLGMQVHRAHAWPSSPRRPAATALRERDQTLDGKRRAGNGFGGWAWKISVHFSVEDRARFFHAAYQFLKAFETIHFHYVYGLMDRQLWMAGTASSPLCAAPEWPLLKLRPEVFLRAVRKFVNALDREGATHGGTLFRTGTKMKHVTPLTWRLHCLYQTVFGTLPESPSNPLTLGSLFTGPGTGITNLPSFSAMKFSVLLLELPLASFFSIVIISFFGWLESEKNRC